MTRLGRKSREIEARQLLALHKSNSASVSPARVINVPRADLVKKFYLDVPDGETFLKVSTGSAPGTTNLLEIDETGEVKVTFEDSAGGVGAVLSMHGVYTSPSDGQVNGLIRVRGRSDMGNDPIIADVYFTNEDVTDGNELGNISIVLQEGGSDVMPFRAKGNDVLIGAGSTLSDTPNHELEVVGDIGFQGDLQSIKSSSTYDVYGYHPLTAPMTSTSFDGDSFSDTSKTKIDMSASFGAPAAAIKAYHAYVGIRDSGSAANDVYAVFHNDATAGRGTYVSCGGLANNAWHRQSVTINADANGDIYYQVEASGSSTFDMVIEILGYYI